MKLLEPSLPYIDYFHPQFCQKHRQSLAWMSLGRWRMPLIDHGVGTVTLKMGADGLPGDVYRRKIHCAYQRSKWEVVDATGRRGCPSQPDSWLVCGMVGR